MLFDKITSRVLNLSALCAAIIIAAYIVLVILDLLAKKADPISTTSVQIGAAKDFVNTFIVLALAVSVFITSGGAVGLKKKVEDATGLPTSAPATATATTPLTATTQYY